MFEIGIDAIIFHIGIFGARWYHIMEIVAIAIYIIFFHIEAKRKDIPIKHVYTIVLLIAFFGLLLGKLTDIMERPQYYVEYPRYMLSLGGIRIGGILIAGFLTMLIYCRCNRLPFWEVSDASTIGIPLAIAIGRIGCFINGCCYGIPCDCSISVIYVNVHSLAPIGEKLFPVQIIQSIWNGFLFVILLLNRKKMKISGLLYLLFLILYSLGDFVIRFMREGNVVFLDLQFAQIMDAVIFIVTFILFLFRSKHCSREPSPV
ncbi:MAG: prolipoprotein diacylglyceryl transferase [Dehalococcoidia bacterium]|nr:prolipoprotein diacylglyceryl transferase [Dehalococcoidia bacterium]